MVARRTRCRFTRSIPRHLFLPLAPPGQNQMNMVWRYHIQTTAGISNPAVVRVIVKNKKSLKNLIPYDFIFLNLMV